LKKNIPKPKNCISPYFPIQRLRRLLFDEFERFFVNETGITTGFTGLGLTTTSSGTTVKTRQVLNKIYYRLFFLF
jgi:hypothetical protein